MAFVNLVDQELGMSLVHATATLNGWPIARHDPALDRDVDDDKDDAPVSDPSKPKTKKRLEKEKAEAAKRAADREARKKEIEQKRKAEALVHAEIKKNAVYVKLLALADAKSWDDLLAAVLASSPRMSQLSEPEFDLIYSLAQSLWQSSKNPTAFIAKYIATLLAAKKYPVTTLKLLSILFNMLNADSRAATPQFCTARFETFKALLTCAIESDTGKLLDGQFKHVDAWSKEWNLNTTQSADLLLLISNVLKAAGQHAESQNYVLKYLSALDKADKKAIEAAKPAAFQAVIAALNSGTTYQFDSLLNLTAVTALKGDAKYDAAYTLLSIFTSQTVEAYQKFVGDQKDFVSRNGLNGEELLRKIRTLTLCSLGVERDRLSFATLKQKLQVADVNAVEACVLDAVVSQCVEAKIDEAAEEVVVLRTTRRAFDASGWKQLASQLGEWKKNVSAVLSTLHQIQNRPVAPATNSDHKS